MNSVVKRREFAVIKKYLKGWLYWEKLIIRYRINYRKVVIVLSDENMELDRQVIKHLGDFVKRKHAADALIFCHEDKKAELQNSIKQDMPVNIISMKDEKMSLLFSFYCFAKFFDNIIFTYTDTPRDNYLGRYLRETDITPEDAACLALYHLRYVPSEI